MHWWYGYRTSHIFPLPSFVSKSHSQEKRTANRYIDSCRDGTRLTVCSKVISSYKCVFKCGISFGRRRTKSFDFGFGLKILLSILQNAFSGFVFYPRGFDTRPLPRLLGDRVSKRFTYMLHWLGSVVYLDYSQEQPADVFLRYIHSILNFPPLLRNAMTWKAPRP